MRKLWINRIKLARDDLLSNQVRGQTFWMFHLKTNNLEIELAMTQNARPFVVIQTMHFVFPFCPKAAGYIVIPISQKTWETEAMLFSVFSSFLPLRVFASPSEILRKFFYIKFTLANLIPRSKSSLLDRGLAEFIFPNTTFVATNDKTCFCCKLNLAYNKSLGTIEQLETTSRDRKYYYELPILSPYNYFDASLLANQKDEYTFLSCDDQLSYSPNFLALFMPFTKTTWALIFVTIFGWPLVWSLIENNFEFKKVLQDFDALFIGWAMILEQSHLRATNYKGRGPLYCYCGCVLLAILVLSNAYKGDNLFALTKSFELVPLTHIDQVNEAGYTKYTNKHCSYRECFVEFFLEANRSGHQFSNEQYKVWEPVNYLLISPTDLDTNGIQVNIGLFGKCHKKALLGWRNVLKPLEKELSIKYKSARVYLGEEFIFTRHAGFSLSRYGSIKVLKRMWTVVESGVYNKLLNISYKPSAGKIFEPRQVTLKGNIFFSSFSSHVDYY